MDFGEWYIGALTTATTVLFGFGAFMIKESYADFKRDREDELYRLKKLEESVSKLNEDLASFRSMSLTEFMTLKEKFKIMSDLSRDTQAFNINLVRLEEKIRIIALRFESDLGKVIRKE